MGIVNYTRRVVREIELGWLVVSGASSVMGIPVWEHEVKTRRNRIIVRGLRELKAGSRD